MTIHIDDAGTGDPLLGAVIGFLRAETGDLHFEWIPIETYQEGTYSKEKPQEEAAKAVMRGLLSMNLKDDEPVMICQGSIFDKARESLDGANIKHEPLKIEGKLQEAVEEEYIKAVEALGIRSKALRVSEDDKEKGYRKRYFVLLNWAKKRPDDREKFVKNGLPFWKYSKDQQEPIPGGWKKARKDFEDKLEIIMKKNADGLTWDKLQNIIKSNFPAEHVWLNQVVSLEPGAQHAASGSNGMRVQLYNSLLSQVYFFIGKHFSEKPPDAAWKAIMWQEDTHAVNGIIFYVARDDQYKQNMKWLQFLRPKMVKLLGAHIRFVIKPF